MKLLEFFDLCHFLFSVTHIFSKVFKPHLWSSNFILDFTRVRFLFVKFGFYSYLLCFFSLHLQWFSNAILQRFCPSSVRCSSLRRFVTCFLWFIFILKCPMAALSYSSAISNISFFLNNELYCKKSIHDSCRHNLYITVLMKHLLWRWCAVRFKMSWKFWW